MPTLTQSAVASIRSAPLAVLGLVLLLGTMTGCQTFDLARGEGALEPTAGDAQNQYQIQLVPQFGRMTVETFPIEPGMTVQSALEQSGATKKFRAMDIVLSRVVKNSGQVLKMPVRYDVGSRSVIPEQDYALHPGDTISARSVSAGSLDKLIDSITGGAL